MDDKHIPLDESMRADDPQVDKERDDHTHEVAPDVAYRRSIFVNYCFIGYPGAGDRGWVLVDTGIPKLSHAHITSAAKERFGENCRPSCIVLTHGHFDHVGAAKDLAEEWDCHVYAHPLEAPYLNGSSAYPEPEPKVGGGMMAVSSPMYPRGPFDLRDKLMLLPEDGTVPHLPDWRWIDVPGHSVGMIALWRGSDRILMAADAFCTTDQESAYAAITQEPKLQGPPMYFTVNWELARTSVEKLAALNPNIVIPGHGRAMEGPEMAEKLRELAARFTEVAVPKESKYLQHPAKAEDGSAYVS